MTEKRKRRHCYYAGSVKGALALNNKSGNLLLDRVNRIEGVIATAMHEHNRLLVQRCDLRTPNGLTLFTGNKSIDAFLQERFIKKLKRQWEPLSKERGKLHYLWCREREKSKKSHWHIALIVDAKFTQYRKLSQIVQKAWRLTLGEEHYSDTLVYLAGFKTASKHDPVAISEIGYWLSYLAKHREGTTINRGMFGGSQVNKSISIPNTLTNEQQQQIIVSHKTKYRNKSQ